MIKIKIFKPSKLADFVKFFNSRVGKEITYKEIISGSSRDFLRKLLDYEAVARLSFGVYLVNSKVELVKTGRIADNIKQPVEVFVKDKERFKVAADFVNSVDGFNVNCLDEILNDFDRSVFMRKIAEAGAIKGGKDGYYKVEFYVHLTSKKEAVKFFEVGLKGSEKKLEDFLNSRKKFTSADFSLFSGLSAKSLSNTICRLIEAGYIRRDYVGEYSVLRSIKVKYTKRNNERKPKYETKKIIINDDGSKEVSKGFYLDTIATDQLRTGWIKHKHVYEFKRD